jgi:RNA polymerase sigma-70 factor (sigma-E family)
MRRDLERDPVGAELERLCAERGNWLMATAIALTGDRADAEDLLQTALERLLRHRRDITGTEAYLRRTLYNLAADGWRRQGAWRRKLAVIGASDPAGEADVMAAVDLRDALMRVLRMLPPQQRTVIVLRYWEQLSEAETATVLGCSEGTVKSAASRGLQRMRELTQSWQEPEVGPERGTKSGLGTVVKLAKGRS